MCAGDTTITSVGQFVTDILDADIKENRDKCPPLGPSRKSSFALYHTTMYCYYYHTSCGAIPFPFLSAELASSYSSAVFFAAAIVVTVLCI